jgi:hypothetical protein
MPELTLTVIDSCLAADGENPPRPEENRHLTTGNQPRPPLNH